MIRIIFEAIPLIFVVFILYSILIWVPVNIYTDAKCLQLGYPEYRVTIGLEKYCLNYVGDVTMKVKKL